MVSVPKRLKAGEVLAFIGETLVIVSQFTGLYYTFDDANHYHREKFYVISYAIPVMIWILQFTMIFQYRKKYDRKLAYALMLVPTLPTAAACIQLSMVGTPLINLTIVGLVIMLRVFEVRNTNRKIILANQRENALLREEQETMRSMMQETSYALAEAIEAKDKYTHGHSSRVAQYSEMIAERAGKDEKERQNIYLAGLLHDVGKIGIPEGIINKDSKLTDEEYAIIKTHPVIGNQILRKITKNPSLSIGAHYHHERYDGRGYPEGLKGEEIPEIARIIAVADAYDAMTSKRSYRDTLPQQVVREEIVKGRGTQFDPQFAEIMLSLIDSDTEYSMKES
ncbi:MAG: HD-GYP domain-containing protein [Oscillospiraceae bacterium]|nr:HD-GYP domain-containing protein [Oscillospiraceae bacterium]